MKKFLLGTTAVVALAAPAMAADMPVKAAPPVTVADVYNWTGFYIGGNFGAGWGRASYQNTANTTFFGDVAGPPGFSHRVRGALAGGQLGYNHQAGNIVFGVEATFDAGNIDGSINPLRGGPPPGGQDDIFTTKVKSLFLATGRVGVARNNWLVYAKGGYASASVRVSVADTGGANQGNGAESRRRSGWVFGGGAEFGLTPNWSIGLEYDRVSLRTANYQLAGAAVGSYAFDARVRDVNLVMGRVNYRFGGPIVASY